MPEDITSKWLWELPELTEDLEADDQLMVARTSVAGLSVRTKRIKKSLLVPGLLRIWVQFAESADGPWVQESAISVASATHFRTKY